MTRRLYVTSHASFWLLWTHLLSGKTDAWTNPNPELAGCDILHVMAWNRSMVENVMAWNRSKVENVMAWNRPKVENVMAWNRPK